MFIFDNKFDGKLQPRPEQLQALDFISHTPDSTHVQLRLGTGFGKSAIAIALARSWQGQTIILTPNNHLADQYKYQYNYPLTIKGRNNYCEGSTPCIYKDKPCRQYERCEYPKFKTAVDSGASYISNIAFFAYNTRFKTKKTDKPRLIILDEYDSMNSLLLELGTLEINTILPSATEIAKALPDMRISTFQRNLLTYAFQHNEEVFFEPNYINNTTTIRFFKPPQYVINLIKANKTKIIQMSGTLNKFHAEELNLTEYAIYEPPHTIPQEIREIIYKPQPHSISNIIAFISQHYDPQKNMLIHCTYELQEELYASLLPKVGKRLIKNGRNVFDKQRCVEQMKKTKGLIWLGSGVAVGVDLPDATCQIQVIPRVIFQHLDEYTEKQKSFRSPQWYIAEGLRTLVQQCGRASRHPTDYSTTYILDNRLPALLQYGHSTHLLPHWFTPNLT